MFDLQTLKHLNEQRVRTLRAQRKARAAPLASAIEQAQSLSLDSAADRRALVRKLAGVL
jgi:hypothetical protein